MRKLKNTELNRKSIDEFKKSKKTSAIVILDNIRSIHNVGSIFRTSDSFLIEKIIISGYTATPENERMKKTALGSSDSVDWEYSDDIIKTIGVLKKKNIKKGDTLVEATSGNTGIALALMAKVLGVNMVLVMPENSTIERVQTMRAYGAKVILTPAELGIEGSRDYALKLKYKKGNKQM